MIRLLMCALLLSCTPRLDAQGERPDPAKAEVSLPALNGWTGNLVLDNDVGVWALRTLQFLPRYGCPEIIALDDKGRCTVLVSYSGKWTPLFTVQDEQWLGTAVHVDLDPQKPGKELYAAGKSGTVYQIWPHAKGGFDTRIVARFPGLEIHSLIAGNFIGEGQGEEVLAFARSGEVFDVRIKSTTGLATFESREVARLPGRVRDALVLPAKTPGQLRIIAALRAQRVMEFRWDAKGFHSKTILQEPMGFGRLARRPVRENASEVLYVTRDDGAVLRLVELGSGDWERSVIFAGPQGPRGLAAGRFHENPQAETLAVFGYSKKVQLLTKLPDEPWKAETIFVEKDKGHWLSCAELDGRNGTDELVGSGYGARVFMLSRTSGYGLKGAATEAKELPKVSPQPREEAPLQETKKVEKTAARIPRLGLSVSHLEIELISPLYYGVGFETKSLLFETLVNKGPDGTVRPGLAQSWEISEDGTQFTFHLRPNAHWHDGTPVQAADVAGHFYRWMSNPDHSWLGASHLIESVKPLSDRSLRVTLDCPYALLEDLCALNPCAIEGPGSGGGDSRKTPCGSGAWRLEREQRETDPLRYVHQGSHRQLDVLRFTDPNVDLLDELIRGKVDMILSPWDKTDLHRRLHELEPHPQIQLTESPGSAVTYLSIGTNGRLRTVESRRALFHALNRQALVAEVLNGHGTPCTNWAAPCVENWKASRSQPPPAPPQSPKLLPKVLSLSVGSSAHLPLALALRKQLKALGIRLDFIPLSDDAELVRNEGYDLRIASTWGLPYEPLLSLKARFLPASAETAVTTAPHPAPKALETLIREAASTPTLKQRIPIYHRIQAWMDKEMPVIPLYVPHRIALTRKPFAPPGLSPDLYRIR